MGRDMNTLTLPSCIPPELLAEIFAHCDPWKSVTSDRIFHRYEYSDNTKILPLAQVCHYWRQVALDHPRLWCHIKLSKQPAYIQMLLERSKDASLYVAGALVGRSIYPDASNPVLLNIPPVFREIQRTCFLFGCLSSESALQFRSLCPNNAFAAPRLTTYMESQGGPSVDDGTSMLRALASPNLRSATVMPTRATLRHLQFRPLAALTIVNIHRELDEFPRAAQALQDVADLLLTTPSLETLHLDFHRDWTLLPASSAETRISLPRLRTLRLKGDLLVLESIVRRLLIPSSTSISGLVSIDPRGEGLRVEDADVPRLAEAVWYMIQRFVGTGDESLTGATGTILGLELHVHTMIRCWSAERPVDFSYRPKGDMYSDDPPIDHLDIDLGYHWNLTSTVIFHHPPTVPAVRYLQSTACRSIQEGHEVLQKLNSIEEVTFHGLSVLRINHLLGIGGDGDSVVPMANLRTMRLVNSSFGVGTVPHTTGHGERREDQDAPLGYRDCTACQGAAGFLRVLKQRRDAGSPIHRLFLMEYEHRWWLTGEEMQRNMRDAVLGEVSVTISPPRRRRGD